MSGVCISTRFMTAVTRFWTVYIYGDFFSLFIIYDY